MPPVPRKQDDLVDIPSKEMETLAPSTISASSNVVKGSHGNDAIGAKSGTPSECGDTDDETNEKWEIKFEPIAIFLRTAATGTLSWYLLNMVGAFDSSSTYWFAVLLVTIAVELSSPALNFGVQYVYPLALVAHYVQIGSFPSLLQAVQFLPTVLFLIGVCMSVCLHRYFAHTAFQTTRLVQFGVGVAACFAYQGGPLWWGAKHVRHHHHCDQPSDPHSVSQQGFLYAFVGWTLNPDNLANRDTKYNNPTHLKFPELHFLDRFYLVPVAIAFTLLEHVAGWNRAYIAYSVLLPMLVCRLVTLLFNVEYHPAEDPKRCKSVDNPRILAVIVGESEHDLHHKCPAKSRRNDWDIPYWLTLSWMEPMGLVWNCR